MDNLYKADEPERIVRLGFLPFGSESFLDAGWLCFDTRQMSNGDCPVVYWDHEEFETDEEIKPLFSSAQAMFRCMRLVWRSPIGHPVGSIQSDASPTIDHQPNNRVLCFGVFSS